MIAEAGCESQALLQHMMPMIEEIIHEDPSKKRGSHIIDLELLRKEFKKHCDDYMEEIGQEGSQASAFCSKIIYVINPESNEARKDNRDRVWRFLIENKGDTNKHEVFVTYKKKASTFVPEWQDYYMTLSLEQANLIAHETFARMVKYAYESRNGFVLLTPLAAACFSRLDVEKMAIELKLNLLSCALAINQSAINCGHLLEHSDPDIAICASIKATRNIKDLKTKESIVARTVRAYVNAGKIPQESRLEVIYKFATGGFPVDLTYDKILKIFNDAQEERKREAAGKMRTAINQSDNRGNTSILAHDRNLDDLTAGLSIDNN